MGSLLASTERQGQGNGAMRDAMGIDWGRDKETDGRLCI